MDRDKPVGGQWNYDQKNRRAYDGQMAIPKALLFKNDVSDICRTIQKMQIKTFGEIKPARLIWPTTRAQSLKLLSAFVKSGLEAFGTYQDAMTAENWYLFHSRLSFALNTKMLRPLEVIQEVLRAWEQKKSPIQIQQVEGFVRQILGWREYIRSMSDYCETCDYDWKKRHGDIACPFNSLYWNFFERHRLLLGKNARVAMMYRVWDRMGKDEKKRILNQADTYLKNLDLL
jgi:deoxyribodipyrimidine photolyase-related protein